MREEIVDPTTIGMRALREEEYITYQPWFQSRVFCKPGSIGKLGTKEFGYAEIPFPGRVESWNGDWLWLGTMWVRLQDAMRAKEAYEHFTRLSEQHPEDAEVWKARGRILQVMGDFSKGYLHIAASDYGTAIGLRPDDGEAYLDRARCQWSLGDEKAAIQDCGQALRYCPQNAEAYELRGSLWCKIGKIRKGIRDLKRGIGLDPDNPYLQWRLGDALVNRGDIPQAVEAYKSAAVGYFKPECSRLAARLLATHPNQSYRNGSEAVELAEVAFRPPNPSPEEIDTLAAAHAEVGDFEKAVRIIEEFGFRTEISNHAIFKSRLELFGRREPLREIPHVDIK